jgi:hypothetical protein
MPTLTAEQQAWLESNNISVPGSGVLDQSTITSLKARAQNLESDSSLAANQYSQAAVQFAMVNSRNASLTDIANQLINTNKLSSAEQDRELQTTKRQVEINTWAYENKMDTLFFLQLLFIFFCITAVILYLRHSLLLSSGITYASIGILFLLILGVLLNRWMYTARRRDTRYWNRKYIAADTNLSSELNKCA